MLADRVLTDDREMARHEWCERPNNPNRTEALQGMRPFLGGAKAGMGAHVEGAMPIRGARPVCRRQDDVTVDPSRSGVRESRGHADVLHGGVLKERHIRGRHHTGEERRRRMRCTGLLADEECGVRVALCSDGRRCDYRTEYDRAANDRHKSHELTHDSNPPW